MLKGKNILSIKNLSKNFDQKKLFQKASLEVLLKERVCLIAPNGFGKSSLIKMILKTDTDYEGTIEFNASLSVMAMSQQLPNSDKSLFEFILEKIPDHQEYLELGKLLDKADADPENSHLWLEKYGEKQSVFERKGGFNYTFEVKKILEGLGFNEQNDFHRPLTTFSGGEIRRALLAQVLVSTPDLLILDEPTNHLDIKNILFLEKFLINYPHSVFFISHDTEFIQKVATHTVAIENHAFAKVKGGFKEYQKNLKERQTLYATKFKQLETEIQKLKPSIEKFRAGTRSTQAQSMQKRLDVLTEELTEYKVSHHEKAPIYFRKESLEKPFDPVLKIKDFNLALENRTFFDQLELIVRRQSKIALLAPNGTGKTLFLSSLVKYFAERTPSFSYGKNVSLGYFKQEDHEFKKKYSSKTPLEYLKENFALPETKYFKYCWDFHLNPHLPIKSLSGGEQSKLRLLALFIAKHNFLVLDEPTNHMDIESREGLKNILKEYEGTLLMVTHDRQILRDLNPLPWMIKNHTVHNLELLDWDEIFQQFMDDKEKSSSSSKNKKKDSSSKKSTKSVEPPKNISKTDQKKQNILQLEISKQEKALIELKELQLEEEYISDYQKANALQEKIEAQQKQINILYQELLDEN